MERSGALLDEALGITPDNNNTNINSKSTLTTSLQSGKLLLIQDCVETSGSFIIHHLLKRTLSSPQSSSVVIFVALSHPFSHYERILRKLGCNLAVHRNNGRFIFFDMLLLGCTGQNEGNLGLIELYAKIQKAVEDITLNGGSRKHITIVLDDFSMIEAAAKGLFNRSLDFLRYCYTLTSEAGCSLVILNHGDIYSEEENSALTLQMEYLTDILIKIEPLATGVATDVHGQLTVLNKDILDNLRGSMNKTRNFHFKLKENGVECFYPGTRA